MNTRDIFLTPPILREACPSLVSVHLAAQKDDVELTIAHEVNQPLAAIALHSAAARKWLSRPEPDVERALASLALISDAVRHAGDIVRTVKWHASRDDDGIECVNVDQAICTALRLLDGTVTSQGIEIALALNLRGATIQANRVQIQQVVTNILVNAIEALSDGQSASDRRTIRVASGVVSGRVEITFEDNGPGIAPVHRGHIFRKRFSTKCGNTGLGMAISLDIVRAHHGSITFEPCNPRGALFRVRFPR